MGEIGNNSKNSSNLVETEKDADGFIKVESKFRYSTSNNKKKRKNKSQQNKYRYTDTSNWTVNDMIKHLDNYRVKLLESDFYSKAIQLVEDCLLPQQPYDMICYGIGSMQNSIPAKYQFTLALIIKDLLNIKGTVSIFDPVMTNLDKEACEYYGISVITINEYCKRTVNKPTLFYMPHCAKQLYNNTISVNWSYENLKNVILIGNDFEDCYIGSQLERDLRKECPYLIPASTILKSFVFPSELFEINNVFNNTSIQYFPESKIPKDKSDTFWVDIPFWQDSDDNN